MSASAYVQLCSTSTEDPTGIGELATVLIAPALLIAIHDATGKRIRTLPMTPDGLKTA